MEQRVKPPDTTKRKGAAGTRHQLFSFLNSLLHLEYIETVLVSCAYAVLLLLSSLFVVLAAAFDVFTLRIFARERLVQPSVNSGPILITGADGEYGYELAASLARAGWVVYAGCSTAGGFQRVRKEVEIMEAALKAGNEQAKADEAAEPRAVTTGKLIPLRLDTSSTVTIKGVVARIAADSPTSGLFALVNCAMVVHAGAVDWLQARDIQHVMEVNYGGMVAATVAVLPLLQKQPGSRIITLTSTLGLCPTSAFLCPFAASCHATRAFTASLRHELAPLGIHVSSVATSLSDAMAQEAREALDRSFDALDETRRDFYGQAYRNDAMSLMHSLIKEPGLDADVVVQSLRRATLSAFPKPEYLVGFDAKLGKGLLRLLPERLRDVLVAWWLGPRVQPLQLKKHNTAAEESPLDSDQPDAVAAAGRPGESAAQRDDEEEPRGPPSGGVPRLGSLRREFSKSLTLDERDSSVMRRCRDMYELMSTVGTGGFSIVKLGLRKTDRRKVALKIIRKAAMRSARAIDMLHTELMVLDRLRQLTHPNIVEFIDKLEDTEGIIMVLEYCPGGDLFTHVSRQGVYSLHEASQTIRQVLTGLAAVHAQGVVHRDIKPENCLVGLDGRGELTLKICDFGLALITEGQGPVKSCLAGTPKYMAPEVLTAHEYSDKCDVWAVGVMLYALLGGCTPFTGMTHEAIFNKIKSGEYCMTGPAWDMVTDSAKASIRRLLDPDPNNRPSAKQALALPFLQEGLPPTDTTPTPDASSPQQHHLPHLMAPLTEAYNGFRRFTHMARFKAVARVCVAHAAQHHREEEEEEEESDADRSPGRREGVRRRESRHGSDDEDEEEEEDSEEDELPSLRGGGLAQHAERVAFSALVCSGKDLLTEAELAQLKKAYSSVAEKRGLDFKRFKMLMDKLGKTGRFPLTRMFDLFDVDGNGWITLQELLEGVGKLKLEGEAAIRFLFDVVDVDGSGSISKEELAEFLVFHRHSLLVQQQRRGLLSGIRGDGKGHGRISEKMVELDPEAYELTEQVAELFTEFDANKSGSITREEFVDGWRRRPDLMELLTGTRTTAGGPPSTPPRARGGSSSSSSSSRRHHSHSPPPLAQHVQHGSAPEMHLHDSSPRVSRPQRSLRNSLMRARQVLSTGNLHRTPVRHTPHIRSNSNSNSRDQVDHDHSPTPHTAPDHHRRRKSSEGMGHGSEEVGHSQRSWPSRLFQKKPTVQ